MNIVVLMGRLTADPEVRYTTGENQLCIASYTLAVDRQVRRDADQTADFIRCKAFGKQAEFAEKYMHKGERFAVSGRIETGSYTDRDGRKVYTTDVIVDRQEFAQAKGENVSQGLPAASTGASRGGATTRNDLEDFIAVPEGLEKELPFN